MDGRLFVVLVLSTSPAFASEPAEHWSFRPISRPALPAARDGKWVANSYQQEAADEAARVRRLCVLTLSRPPKSIDAEAVLTYSRGTDSPVELRAPS